MNNGISIIIPCYNCEKTLEKAVDSCYSQGLSETDFEVIMVNDASTDSTIQVMNRIAGYHKNSRIIENPTNRGGGATRNTGIRSASGKYIFCLDSDNFFGGGSPLLDMREKIETEHLDGASIYERRFFVGNDHVHFEPYINTLSTRDIKLADLFSKDSVLLDNFMFTKDSYIKAGGYPENHGFDTQCFEIRYLSKGFRVRSCEGTVFYHRQASNSTSYFEREYDKGNFSRNYYLIAEDIFDKFSFIAKKTIINFDIFERSSMQDNLMLEMKKLASQDQLFSYSETNEKGANQNMLNCISNFQASLNLFKSGNYETALEKVRDAQQSGLDTKVTRYLEARCIAGQNGTLPNRIDDEVSKQSAFRPRKQRLYRIYHRIPLINRVILKIIKWRKSI